MAATMTSLDDEMHVDLHLSDGDDDDVSNAESCAGGDMGDPEVHRPRDRMEKRYSSYSTSGLDEDLSRDAMEEVMLEGHDDSSASCSSALGSDNGGSSSSSNSGSCRLGDDLEQAPQPLVGTSLFPSSPRRLQVQVSPKSDKSGLSSLPSPGGKGPVSYHYVNDYHRMDVLDVDLSKYFFDKDYITKDRKQHTIDHPLATHRLELPPPGNDGELRRAANVSKTSQGKFCRRTSIEGSRSSSESDVNRFRTGVEHPVLPLREQMERSRSMSLSKILAIKAESFKRFLNRDRPSSDECSEGEEDAVQDDECPLDTPPPRESSSSSSSSSEEEESDDVNPSLSTLGSRVREGQRERYSYRSPGSSQDLEEFDFSYYSPDDSSDDESMGYSAKGNTSRIQSIDMTGSVPVTSADRNLDTYMAQQQAREDEERSLSDKLSSFVDGWGGMAYHKNKSRASLFSTARSRLGCRLLPVALLVVVGLLCTMAASIALFVEREQDLPSDPSGGGADTVVPLTKGEPQSLMGPTVEELGHGEASAEETSDTPLEEWQAEAGVGPNVSKELFNLVVSLSGYFEIHDKYSPAHRALLWLVNEDPSGVAVADVTSESIGEIQTPWQIHVSQRYALASFYHATGGPKGDWTKTSEGNPWLSGEHECHWSGVSCKTVEGVDVVSQLDLQGRKLNGPLPMELRAFKHMEHLILNNNNINGMIPSWIDEMESLETLFLNNNMLTGTVPHTVSFLPSLEELWLEGNALSGDISDGICDSLPSLQVLAADCNGPVPRVRCPCCSVCFP